MEFNKPEPLKLTGNVAENYKLFKEEVLVFFEATETTTKPEKVQVARLLNLIGSDGVKIYRTFNVEPKDETVEIVFKKLEEYCTPKRNEVMEHYRFFMRKQEFSEPFDKFYADLRNLIKSCGFGVTEEKLLRTQIVLGISDKDLQSKLLREDVSLEKVIRHCQATEQAEINRKILVQENETKIEVMEKKKLNKPNKYSSTRWAMEKQQQQQNQLPIKQEGGENLRKTPRESDVQKDGPEPEFLNPMENVTVALGREAILVCSVKNIGEHKVGWLKAEDQTILSLHERVVTENRRIDIDVDNNTYWRLKIRQLQRSDKGCYMCQINTHVMKKQIGCVDVKVPPDIKDEETISDITVNEGENATLACKAKGNPLPRITWKREDGHKITIKNKSKKTLFDRVRGEPLLLNKVDRSQMGHYLCIASNDVPPAVSKRITLNVNFSPVVWVTNQIVSAPLQTHVRLECFVESFPNSVNYWSNEKGDMILQGPKYFIEEVKTNYKVNMYLNIQNLDVNDLGAYICLARNSMGYANSSVRVHKIILPTTTVPPTTSTTTAATTTTTTTTLPSTTRLVATSTVIPSPATKWKSHTISGDRKSGGKMDDKTGLRMNGVESAGEMETKSSSHRASRGSSRVRRSTVSQSVSIAAELAFLAAATASWSTGCPVDAAIGGLVSLALAVSPPLILWLLN